MKQNLKTFLRFSRCGAPLFARRLSKTGFWPYVFTPLFLSSFFCCVALFLLGGLLGTDLFFFGIRIRNLQYFERVFSIVLLPFLCFAKRSSTRVVKNHRVQGTWVPPGIVKPCCNGFRRVFFDILQMRWFVPGVLMQEFLKKVTRSGGLPVTRSTGTGAMYILYMVPVRVDGILNTM